MSTVDDRIVEMQFDNAAFEKNAKQSLSTLDKLKNAINIGESAKGLKGLDSVFSNSAFHGMAGNLDFISSRFTAMGMVAQTVMQNIINKVVQTGEHLVKEFTIEPVTGGFREYELKMGSVQTIMASSKKDLETVNGVLAELNTYADKTIYSFSDMTSSIGKFTNAGVDLDTAVKAIQGISNEAALSGANANEASRAMYNFAQALSSGAVKLIDWKSIENANMATEEFKSILLESAEKMGTVEKTSDGMYKALTKGAGGGFKEAFTSTAKFNDSLSSCWMTTEVLIDALSRYSDADDDVGRRAFAAAQDVKTFSQLMDTLKEAAESGWGESLEYIVGDFEEAKELWTGVNNIVSGILDGQAESRNKLLKEALDDKQDIYVTQQMFEQIAKDSGVGRKNLLKQNEDILKEHGTTVKELLRDQDQLQKAFDEGWFTVDDMTNASRGLVGEIKQLSDGLLEVGMGATSDDVKELQERLVELGYTVGDKGLDGIIGKDTLAALHEFQKEQGLEVTDIISKETLDALNKGQEGFNNIAKAAKEAGMSEEEYREKVLGVTEATDGRALAIDSIYNVYKAISSAIGTVGNAFNSVMPKLTGSDIFNAISKIHDFTENLSLSFTQSLNLAKVGSGLGNTLSFIGEGFKTLGGPVVKLAAGAMKSVADYALQGAGAIGGWLSKVTNAARANGFWTKSLDTMRSFLEPVGSLLSKLATGIKMYFDSLDKQAIMDKFTNKLKPLQDLFAKFGEKIASIRDNFAEWVDITDPEDILSGIQHAIHNLTNNSLVENVVNGFKRIKDAILGLFGKNSEIDPEGGPFEKLKEYAQPSGFLPKLMSNFELLKKSIVDAGGVFKFLGGVLSSFVSNAGTGIIDFIAKLVNGKSILGLAKAVIGFKSLATIIDMFKNISGLSGILGNVSEMFENFGGIVENFKNEGIGGLLGGSGEGFVGQASKLAKAFMTIAGGVLMLAFAFEKFASFNLDQVGSGLIAMGSSLAMVTSVFIAMKEFVPPEEATKIATAFTIMGVALNLVALAFGQFAGLGLEKTASGFWAMAGAMTVVLASMAVMKEVGPAIKGAAALMVMAAAMNILALAFKQFATMSFEDTGKALVAMMGAMGTVLLGMSELSAIQTGLLPAAVAMTIMAGAMFLMAGAFKAFADVKIESIGTAFVGLIASLAIMAGAAALVDAFGIALLAAAGIIAAFGLALSVLSGGLNGVSEAFKNLSSAGASILPQLSKAWESVKSSISQGVSQMVEAFKGIGSKISEKFQNVKDWIFNGGLSDALSDAITWGGDLISNLVGGLKGIGNKIRSKFTQAKNWVFNGSMKNAVTNALTWGKDLISNITGSLKGVGEKIKAPFARAKNWIFGSDGLGAAFRTAKTWGSDMITKLTDGIKDVGSSIKGFFVGAKNWVFGEGEGNDGLGSIISGALSWGGDVISNLTSGLGDVWSTITSHFNVSWEDVSTGLSEIPGKLYEWATSLPGQIVDGVSSIGGSVIDALKKLIFGDDADVVDSSSSKAFGDAIENQMEAGIEDINFSPYTESVFVGISDELAEAAENAEGVLDAGKTVGKNVVEGIGEGITMYKSTLSTSLTNIFNDLNDSFFTSKGSALGVKFANGILDSKVSAQAAGSGLSSAAASALSSFTSSAIQSGNYFGQGFGNGIQQEGGYVWQKAYQLGKDAVSALKKAIKEGSPSKLTFQSGKFFGQGFFNGIVALGKQVTNAATNMGKGAVDGLSTGIEHIGGILNGSLKLDPSIRPILDLSDIKNGIQIANGMLSGLGSTLSPSFAGIQGAVTTRNQNANPDVVGAINRLGNSLQGVQGNTYNVGGVSYADGSPVATAIDGLIMALELDRRM